MRDAPRTVGPEAAHDHQIEVLGDHLPDGVRVDTLGRELGESPELAKGPARRVRVEGSKALVASCRGKQPIERFGGAALANYLDIRSEPRAVRISSRYVRAPAPSMFARWAYSGIAAG